MGRTLHDHDQEDAIRQLLVGRSIVRIDEEETLVLDNGVNLTIFGNDGCGGCSAGNYRLTEISDAEHNVIMAVEFDTEEITSDPNDWTDERDTAYRVFVLTFGDKRYKLLQVEGTDGNGYYGTGYWIEVS